MADYDDLNVPMIAAIGLIGAALTVAVIIGLQALYYNYERSDSERKAAEFPDVATDNLLVEEKAKLNSYSWVDRENGEVAIPVDRAKAMVVRELRSQQMSQETPYEI
jgi:hypothetical protein